MPRVAGKIALVTGGAGGIGEAIVRKLAEHGASVIVADVDEAGAARLVAELRQGRHEARCLALDVADEKNWAGVESDVAAREGRLDILVNSAGIFAKTRHPIDTIPFAEWRRILAVNLDGTFLGIQCAVRLMKARGGAIVNIGSMAGVSASRGGAAYGASKGGVGMLTRQAAFSCAKAGYGIRVNGILPGYVWTPGIAELAQAEYGGLEEARAGYARRHPLNRIIEAEDIANAALYLASDEARTVTGTDVTVDGGLLATLWGVT